MKRNVLKRTSLAMAAAVILFMFGCSVHDDPQRGAIELNNNSTVTVDAFYLAPADGLSWGPNILAGPLFSGDWAFIEGIDAGLYDAKIRSTGIYSDYYGYEYDIPISAGVIRSLFIYNSSFTGSLEIRNRSVIANIIAVYVVPADAPSWGVNQASFILRPNEALHLDDLSPGLYDVRIVWNIGPDSIYYDVRVDSLALTILDVD